MKMVIYKSLGDLYVTAKENYDAPIQDARLKVKAVGFTTADEIIEYYCENFGCKPEDFTVVL